MKGNAKQKVPGGKLISIKLEYGTRIEHIEILGDFFLYPEESLALIEKKLLNTKIDESEEEIAEKIRKIVDSHSIELIGITPQSIAKTIKMAIVK